MCSAKIEGGGGTALIIGESSRFEFFTFHSCVSAEYGEMRNRVRKIYWTYSETKVLKINGRAAKVFEF